MTPDDSLSPTAATKPKSRPRRRWWSLSVRGLMLLVLVTGGLIGWEANRVSRMRRAIAVLKRKVEVKAEDLGQFSKFMPKSFMVVGGSKVQLILEDFDWSGKWLSSPRLRGVVGWVRRWIGDEHFERVSGLGFARRPTSADWDAIQALGSVRELDFASINVTDEDLIRLPDCARLRVLDLSDAPITDKTLAVIGRLPDLRSLNIEGTHTSNDGLAFLKDQFGLEELMLRDDISADAGLIHLRNLRKLRSLKFGRVSDQGLDAIRGNTPLETLSFAAWHLTDKGWTVVTGFPNLEKLHVSRGRSSLIELFFNHLEDGEPIKLTGAAVRSLAQLTHLEELNLDGVVDNAWMPSVGQLSQLRSLTLRANFMAGNRISDLGLKSLGPLGQLRLLTLQTDQIGDDGLVPVGRLVNLEELTILSGPKITDAGMKHLTPLVRLKRLSLNARVSGEGIAAIRAAIPSLQSVNNMAAEPDPTPAKP